MSGPGEVAILWSNAQGGALRLGNFDIEKHRLKREHIEDGLRQKVLPVLEEAYFWLEWSRQRAPWNL